MKLTNFITFGAAVGMAIAPIAASQAQSVASADYLVVRDGKVVSAPGALMAGDRVITRGSTGATVALGGCSVDVPAASTVTLTATACDSTVQSLNVARAGYSMEGASTLHGSGYIVGLLALAAIIAAAIIASNGKKTPTSP